MAQFGFYLAVDTARLGTGADLARVSSMNLLFCPAAKRQPGIWLQLWGGRGSGQCSLSPHQELAVAPGPSQWQTPSLDPCHAVFPLSVPEGPHYLFSFSRELRHCLVNVSGSMLQAEA